MPLDLVTKLMLDAKGFDRELERSKAQTKAFQSAINATGATIMKFAGGLGAAVTISEGFTKAMNSSQTTGDALTKVLDQGRSSVNSFFASLAMGDLSGFISNLKNVITEAGKLSEVLDELGTKTLFSNAELNKLMTEKKIQENIARNRTKSDAERNKALEEARRIQLQINSLQQNLAKQNETSALAMARSAMANQGYKGAFGEKDLSYFTAETNRSEYNQLADKLTGYKKQIEASKQLQTVVSTAGGTASVNTIAVATDETKRLNKEFAAWLKTEEGSKAERAHYFRQLADDNNSQIAQVIKLQDTARNMYGAISDAQLSLDNVDAKINGSASAIQKEANKPVTIPVQLGSKKNISEQITKLTEQIDAGTKPEIQTQLIIDREKLREQLNDITKQEKQYIDIVYNAKPLAADFGKPQSNNPANSLDIFQSEINAKALKNITQAQQAYAKGWEKPTEMVNAMSSALGGLSGIVGEQGATWLQWSANMLSAIGSAIPALRVLIEGNKMAAITGAAASSVAIPGVGFITALASIVGMVAAFASLPKFASGGIVPGSSLSGDNILARVNSGEMILNQSQQGNMFRMLNSVTNAGNGQSEPMNVRFVIEGDKLVGAINNFNRKERRGR